MSLVIFSLPILYLYFFLPSQEQNGPWECGPVPELCSEHHRGDEHARSHDLRGGDQHGQCGEDHGVSGEGNDPFSSEAGFMV